MFMNNLRVYYEDIYPPSPILDSCPGAVPAGMWALIPGSFDIRLLWRFSHVETAAGSVNTDPAQNVWAIIKRAHKSLLSASSMSSLAHVLPGP
jgi:hypothetical protein